MNDFILILLYEFFQLTNLFWYNLFLYLSHIVILYFKKIIYIPKQTDLNLQKIILTYDNQIILYNFINLNYYDIRIVINNKLIHIIGNNKNTIVNYNFYKYNRHNNILITPDKSISMYILPIKIYDQEDCGVCFMNQGTLVGLCGHQNICKECINMLNKCPMCNNHLLFNQLNPKIISYILN